MNLRRDSMRRSALLHELSYVYELGIYEKPGYSQGTHQILRPAPVDDRGLTDDQIALLLAWTAQERLIDDTVEGYMAFRRGIDGAAIEIGDTLLHWRSRMQDPGEAVAWIGMEVGDRDDSEFMLLREALELLRQEMRRWFLAPGEGYAPLLGPFAAALGPGTRGGKDTGPGIARKITSRARPW